MDFIKSIKDAIGILKLNLKTIDNVAKDKKATNAGILILIIGGFIAGIASKNLVILSIMPVVVLISSFIGIGIIHLIAKLFKGEAEFIELYRVMTHAGILNWLSIFDFVPVLKTVIAGITFVWGIIVNFVAIKNIYKLSTLKTVFVILIPLVLFAIITIVVTTMYMTSNPEAATSLLGIQ